MNADQGGGKATMDGGVSERSRGWSKDTGCGFTESQVLDVPKTAAKGRRLADETVILISNFLCFSKH